MGLQIYHRVFKNSDFKNFINFIKYGYVTTSKQVVLCFVKLPAAFKNVFFYNKRDCLLICKLTKPNPGKTCQCLLKERGFGQPSYFLFLFGTEISFALLPNTYSWETIETVFKTIFSLSFFIKMLIKK